ncbi:hypothetical protein ACLOJK_014191 [Asimina triloba]
MRVRRGERGEGFRGGLDRCGQDDNQELRDGGGRGPSYGELVDEDGYSSMAVKTRQGVGSKEQGSKNNEEEKIDQQGEIRDSRRRKSIPRRWPGRSKNSEEEKTDREGKGGRILIVEHEHRKTTTKRREISAGQPAGRKTRFKALATMRLHERGKGLRHTGI